MSLRTTPRRALLSLLVIGLLAAGCGDDVATDAGPSSPEPPAAGRGWLEGDDLDWTSGGAAGGLADGGGADDAASLAAEGASDAGDTDRATTADGGPVPVEPVPVEPVPVEPVPVDPPVDDTPLRAGSIDDAADVDGYLAYRDGITGAGVAVRDLDVRDSTVITIVGDNGLPVLDARVEVRAAGTDGAPLVELRTTATGSVRWLPHAMAPDGPEAAVYELTVHTGETTTTAELTLGEPTIRIEVPVPGGVDGAVALDVHFVLDATGSMGDEIARLRDNMRAVAEQITALPAAPDVRFGTTVYRDEGDLFVTRTFDLTGDLDGFLQALADVVADGGGDYPEAMDEALADALEKPAWRRDGAVELVFLIADAPPQVARQVARTTGESAIRAATTGVKIFPVAASGTDDQAEYVMRELAFVTGGRFVFLAYGEGSTATGAGSDIVADDFDELPLDQLVVRLVEDELAALGPAGGPSATSTTTTQPVTTTTYEQ